MSSALTATVDGENVYSVFQQGAGLVDAVNAVGSDAAGCANASLDVAKDLRGEEHKDLIGNIKGDSWSDVEGSGFVWQLNRTGIARWVEQE